MSKKAEIYRMVTPTHLCPWGVKALDLLKRHGYEVEDHHLGSREANRAYKETNGVDETPQIFIGGEHLGGHDDLRAHLGLKPDPAEDDTYVPVIVVGAVALGLALAFVQVRGTAGSFVALVEAFIAMAMVLLGMLKLQNLQGFATGFVQYDLLARRYVPYAGLYAFLETGAGLLMLAGIGVWLAAPLVLVASSIGAVSVFKAVYLEKRDLNCACVGGGSRVPLGFISLTENLLMMAMSVWMLVRLATH